MILKILSWNIWIDGDFDGIVDYINKSNADIIGLQEVVDNDPERKIIDYLKSAGYNFVFAPVSKFWDGVEYKDGPAVFSKYPIEKREIHILSKQDPRAAAQADIRIGNKILHVFSTHLLHTHQKESLIQEEQAKNLVSLVPKTKSIIMGDFNALPDSNAIKMMSHSFKDADSQNLPTWSLYEAGCETCKVKDIVYKLDYIFTSEDLKTKNYKVEASKASDHLPISVEIEI